MPATEGFPPFGPGYKVAFRRVAGPSSYAQGGFAVTLHELNSIDTAVVSLRNNPGNKLIAYEVSGNTITIKIYTISADTSTGAISAAEDAGGTDESSLEFEIIAIGR